MSNKDQVVSGATTYLRRVGGRRTNKQVTADDVHTYLDREGYTANSNDRISVVRSVLQEPLFKPVGFVQSEREAARGRMIRRWKVAKSS